MKFRKSIILAFFIMLKLICFMAYSQQVVPSSGCSVKAGINVNWILCGSLTDLNSYKISPKIVTENAQVEHSQFLIKVYPTLTTNNISVEVSPYYSTKFLIELFNISGIKVIDEITMKQPVLSINLSNLISGIYFVKVSLLDNNGTLKYEKIVKL